MSTTAYVIIYEKKYQYIVLRKKKTTSGTVYPAQHVHMLFQVSVSEVYFLELYLMV